MDHDPPDLCRVAVARGLKMLTKTLGRLGLDGPVGRQQTSRGRNVSGKGLLGRKPKAYLGKGQRHRGRIFRGVEKGS